MKQRRQAGLGNHFVERIDIAVVREKALDDGVKLEALDAEILDEAARFTHPHFAARRVDAGEGNADVGMLGGGFGHFFVGDAADAHAAFVIDGEDHEGDLFLAVVGRHLRDGRVLDLVAEVAPARFERLRFGFVGQKARRGLRVGVNVNRDQRVQIHFQHRAFLFSARDQGARGG